MTEERGAMDLEKRGPGKQEGGEEVEAAVNMYERLINEIEYKKMKMHLV